jgi:hypothetical protein
MNDFNTPAELKEAQQLITTLNAEL